MSLGDELKSSTTEESTEEDERRPGKSKNTHKRKNKRARQRSPEKELEVNFDVDPELEDIEQIDVSSRAPSVLDLTHNEVSNWDSSRQNEQ